jgi:hypothetical protein
LGGWMCERGLNVEDMDYVLREYQRMWGQESGVPDKKTIIVKVLL